MKQPLIISLFLLLPTLASAAPVFSIQPKNFDFRSVEEGTVVQKTFTITNKGNEALEIQKVAPSCGCTASALATTHLAPGASTTLDIKIDTQGFYGGIAKKVFVFTNDPSQATVSIGISGSIKPDIVVEPTMVDFGDVSIKNGSNVRRIQVHSVKGGGAASVAAGKFLEATIVERGEVSIRVKPDAPMGDLHDRVVIKAQGLKTQTVVPVVARIRGDIWSEPSALSFGVVRKGAQEKRTVRLNGAVSQAKIEAHHKALSVNVRRSTDEVLVDVVLNSGFVTKEEFQEQIKITAQNGDEIFIPVLAVVAQEK
jgi:hypothetical protein